MDRTIIAGEVMRGQNRRRAVWRDIDSVLP
jgi:hypothetical protein